MRDAYRSLTVPTLAACCVLAGFDIAAAQAPACATMRKINVGVSVAPPNVVHTTPYVAKALGFFAKRCIDANIVQFEGGQSQTANVGGRAGLGDRERERCRDRPRPEGAADLGPRAAHAAGLHGRRTASRPPPTSRASGCRRPAAASAVSTGGWAARCSRSAGLTVGRRAVHSVADRRPPAGPDRRARSTASRCIPRTSFSPRSRSRR